MADLAKIVEDLSSLTVLEAAELSKLLEEKWGVSAAAPVAMAMPAGGGAIAACCCANVRLPSKRCSCTLAAKPCCCNSWALWLISAWPGKNTRILPMCSNNACCTSRAICCGKGCLSGSAYSIVTGKLRPSLLNIGAANLSANCCISRVADIISNLSSGRSCCTSRHNASARSACSERS